MQATTSTAGQAIGRQIKNTTHPDVLHAPEHGDHGGQDGQTPETGQQPDPEYGLFVSVVMVVPSSVCGSPIRSRCSASTSGQDGWSRPTTSGRPLSGMGSSYSSSASASSGTGGPYSWLMIS
jgi:hypothetical protein